jgi:hypothetical protein
MTREKLKQMGEAAGISPHAFGLASEEAWQQVERFADLVAAAEREAKAEYELWGMINGSPGGTRPIQQVEQINPNELWPAGTALYVWVGGRK